MATATTDPSNTVNKPWTPEARLELQRRVYRSCRDLVCRVCAISHEVFQQLVEENIAATNSNWANTAATRGFVYALAATSVERDALDDDPNDLAPGHARALARR